MIVTIAQQKGGAGKTMAAGNLAAGLHSPPKRRVVALDLDPQQSLAQWAGRGDAGGALAQLVRGLPEEAVARAQADAEARGLDEPDYLPIAGAMLAEARQAADVVLLDTPPSFHPLSVFALAVADVVVVPVMPSVRDLDAADQTVAALVDACAQEGRPSPPIVWLPSRVVPRTRLTADLKAALAERGRALEAVAASVVHAEAELHGLTTREYKKAGMPAEEWRIATTQLARVLTEIAAR